MAKSLNGIKRIFELVHDLSMRPVHVCKHEMSDNTPLSYCRTEKKEFMCLF